MLKLVRMVVLCIGIWAEILKGSNPVDTATHMQFVGKYAP